MNESQESLSDSKKSSYQYQPEDSRLFSLIHTNNTHTLQYTSARIQYRTHLRSGNFPHLSCWRKDGTRKKTNKNWEQDNRKILSLYIYIYIFSSLNFGYTKMRKWVENGKPAAVLREIIIVCLLLRTEMIDGGSVYAERVPWFSISQNIFWLAWFYRTHWNLTAHSATFTLTRSHWQRVYTTNNRIARVNYTACVGDCFIREIYIYIYVHFWQHFSQRAFCQKVIRQSGE